MKWIKAILREGVGLFIDDGIFTSVIVGWLAFTCVLRFLIDRPVLSCILLPAGLLAILVESTARFARRSKQDT